MPIVLNEFVRTNSTGYDLEDDASMSTNGKIQYELNM